MSRKLSPGSLSFQKSELVLPEGLGGMGGGTRPTGGHSGPVFAANPRAMQGFRGAPGGAFFGLQRVGPETTLQWRNVSPMMLVMLAWRRPMMLLMLACRR